jgi:polysaccharide biosynthesis/export protein ExoF
MWACVPPSHPSTAAVRPLPALVAAALMLFFALSGALAQTQPSDSGDYVLSGGDILQFDLADDEQAPQPLTIGDDGIIQAPLLGPVNVGGLTLAEARARLNKLYTEGKIFNNPSVAIWISTYRPIFVLGDVRSPGSFPYQPGLTVEKAIGLAGGMLTLVGTGQDQILSRAKLQGELVQSNADITTGAVTIARLTAQLNDRMTISEGDIPAKLRPFVDNALLQTLIPTAERYLKETADARKTQIELLQQNLQEAMNALDTLSKLADNQKEAIQYSQSDYDRADALLKKGLKTATEVSALQRQLTIDEGRLLSIYSQVSSAKNGIGSLKRELANLQVTWRQPVLTNLQDETAKLESLVSARRALEEQLYLVTNWTSEEALRNRTAVVSYKIRRKQPNKESEEMVVTPVAKMRADDVLMVTVQTAPPTIGAPAVSPSASTSQSPSTRPLLSATSTAPSN